MRIDMVPMERRIEVGISVKGADIGNPSQVLAIHFVCPT